MHIKQPTKPKRGAKVQGGYGVIYARYSSHAQRDVSIEQQVTLCNDLANERGIEIKDVYSDRAITGKTDKRPEFQRLMRDAAKRKFSYVLAWKSNRIGRNMLEAMINETKLRDYGIRILYVEEDFDDTAAGRFAARSMMNVNQFYSENMAEDIVRGLQSNAEKCMVTNGHLPFGYKADETLHYALDEPKDAIVREIFSRVAAKEPLVDIYTDLNNRGVKTSSGNEWGKSSFYHLLKNERYRGIYIYGDVRIEGGIPRIISEELFFEVQEVIKMKKSTRRRHGFSDFLLTGKLFCGECRSAMVGTSGTSKTGDTHYYYACNKKHDPNCKKKAVRRDLIEREVARGIKEYVLRDNVKTWIADNIESYQKQNKDNEEIQLLSDQLAGVKLSIKNILSAIEKGVVTDTTKERLQELEAEHAKISNRITVIKSMHIEVSREQVIGWLESFEQGDISNKEYQLRLFDSFLKAVYLFDDGKIKLAFDIFGGDESTLEIDLTDDGVSSAEGSSKLSFEPPCKLPAVTQTSIS